MSAGSTLTFGTPILLGDNTIPGCKVPKEIEEAIPNIFQQCSNFGLDYYPTIVEFLTYDEISEVASYGGFPVRYPHWQFGMEYEELSKGYEFGMHRIYEMVVNTNPCYIYCLDSNTYTDNVTVIAHALGHNHFFKNNLWFKPTSQNMMNEFANHRSRILRYMQRWGEETVGEFIDWVLSIETLIDPAKAWSRRKYVEPVTHDSREYNYPRRLQVEDNKDYMGRWINPPSWIEDEKKRIAEDEVRKSINIWEDPSKDIMGFVRDHAPLTPWQADVLAMMYEEAMYFQPQRMTKMLNEGMASFVDFNIMARLGMPGCDIVEYAAHKAGVLGGKESMNPYKLGFELLLWIEECWNKGKFGREYEDCQDNIAKENWDKKLGLGREKVFEVCALYDDVMAIAQFFDQEFCDKHKFYVWKKYPSNEPGIQYEWRIVNRDAKQIKQLLMKRYMNGGLPVIKLVDPNFKGKGIMLLEHTWDGRTLHPKYAKETLVSLYRLWQKPCAIVTRDKDDKEVVWYCDITKNPDGDKMPVTREMSRKEVQDL